MSKKILQVIFILTLYWRLQPTLADTCDSNGARLPSQYEQYCCADINRGKSIVLTGQQRKYFLCPFEKLSSCTLVGLSPSCSDILRSDSSTTSGYYNIALGNGTTVTVYCDMEDVNCDGEGGWMRVAYLNMSDPNEQCPPGFRLYEENGIRACGKQSGGCQSVVYQSFNISYSQVCGRVIGYQKGSTDAIDPYGPEDIEQAYVDGVSITRGSPRKHIWTFMAALQENSFYTDNRHECPCAPNSPVTPQSFVGNDYFCESGTSGNWDYTTIRITDPLWDGQQYGLIEKECCNATGIGWFNKVLKQPTTDYIELRVCCDNNIDNEDAPVEAYQLFVK